MKWLSAFLSILVVSAFAAFYFWNYGARRSYLKERDQRLVASGARALLDAVQADETRSRVARDGTTLAVTGLATTGGEGYRVRLVDVLERVGRPESFAALLVADDKGNVLAQHPRARMDGLRRLGLLETGKEQVGAQSDGPEAFGQRASAHALRFGERALLALCHPAPLAPGPKGEPGHAETLVVCGLVDEARRDREAGAVSPLVLACLLAILALALLVPPFLKVHLLTRPERLRFADAFALLACQFLGLMIATTAIFGSAVYHGLAARADAELESVARELQGHLATELTQIDAQLRSSDADLSWVHAGDASPRGDGGLTRASLLARPLCSPDGGKCAAWGAALGRYPYFESLAWMAPDGQQRVKWWTRPAPELFFDVSRRSYFTDVRDGLLTRVPAGSPWPNAIVLASVRAWSSGDVRAVVARRAGSMLPDGTPLPAQALTTRLISLDDPVLPAGVGFALIDGRGEVQFHSQGRLSLSHNLFDETARDPRLRTAVLERARDTLSVTYWGRPHRVHVEPLGPLPWSLLVFRDQALLRAIGVETLAEALLLCLAFTFAIFLLPALACVAVAGRRTPFPWPNRELAWLYLHLTFAFLVIAVLYMWGLARAHGEDALTLSLALPAAALLAAATVLAGRVALQRSYPDGLSQRCPARLRLATAALGALLVLGLGFFARTPLGLLVGASTSALLCLALIQGSDRLRPANWFRIPHRLASCGFWLLFAMLPAVGFVKGASERALDAGATRGLGLFATRLDERARALRAAHHDDAKNAAALYEQRLADHRDVYAGSLYSIAWHAGAAEECAVPRNEPSAPAPGFSGWLGALLSAVKPILGEEVVGQRYARAPRDAHGRAQARFRVCGSAPGQTVRGGPPAFGAVVGALPWLVLAALALGNCLIVRWAERTLFATGASALASRSSQAVLAGLPDGTRLLLLAPSGFERRELLAGAWYDPLPDRPQTSACAGAPLLLTESALLDGDAARRRARLDVLESCLRFGTRPIVLLASLPPSAWLADLPATDAAERLRLDQLLESFELAALRSDASAAAPQDVARAVRAWLGPEAERRAADAAWLADEVQASPHVFALCAARLGAGTLAQADRGAILRRLAEAAGSYYRSLWQACGVEERLTLVQLVDEGFVNPRRLDVIEGLLAKGLLRFRSALEPMNASFAAFVAGQDNRALLKTAETRAAGFGWAHLRAPLLALGAAAAAFLCLTERSVFDSAAGLSALMVGSVVPLLGQIARGVQNLTRVAQAPGDGAAGQAG